LNMLFFLKNSITQVKQYCFCLKCYALRTLNRINLPKQKLIYVVPVNYFEFRTAVRLRE
jgi:hypothetical protein